MPLTTSPITLHLDMAEVALLIEALETHRTTQLPGEDAEAPRYSLCKAIERRFHSMASGLYSFLPDEAAELVEALDSHLYWAVSDPRDRSNGFVDYENDARSRDPRYAEACRSVDLLAERLGAPV
jgi:hypothetical protein